MSKGVASGPSPGAGSRGAKAGSPAHVPECARQPRGRRGEAGGVRERRAGQGGPCGWTKWKSLDFVFNVKGQSLGGLGEEG